MNKQGFEQQLSEQDFALLLQGKQGGFAAAYRCYADHVYSLSLHIVCDEEIASDMLQTIFEYLIKNRKRVDSCDSLGPWLKRCTINACMEYFRLVRKEQAFVKKHSDGTDILAEPTKRLDEQSLPYQDSEVAKLINQLPEAQRSMVYLHTVQNMKHREVVKNLKVNESSSGQSSQRVLQRLKSWLTGAK